MRNLSSIISRTIVLTVLLMVSTIVSAREYHFQTLSTHNGLTNNSVKALCVDSRGFLWIGTDLGLNRYDGYSIRNFYSYDNSQNVPITNIKSIQEDALGYLWIRNDASIMRYDYRSNSFDLDNTKYLESLGFKMKKDFCLQATSSGELWVVTNGMIQRKDLTGKTSGTQTWKVNITLHSPCEWYLDGSGDDLLLTDGKQLWRFCCVNGRLQRIILPQSMLSDIGHLRIYADYDGVLWVYSMISEHICCIPAHTTAQEFALPSASATDDSSTLHSSASNAIRRIFDDGQGQIWIATDHNGVFVYNKQDRQFRHIFHNANDITSLPSNNVTTILCDQQGTVWMGHLNSGVSFSNERYNLFTHFGGLSNISTMLFDTIGNLWLGTDGNGLYVRHNDGSVEKTALPDITISSILEDHAGTIWVGTYNNGLYRMQGTQQYTLFNKENGHLPHNSVWQMYEDEKGTLWYTSVFEQLACFNPSTEQGAVYGRGGKTVSGISFASNGKGTIFCGTYYGIWIYDIHSGRARYALGNNSGTQHFHDMHIGPMLYDQYTDRLWIGHRAGMTVWDTKRDTLYYINSKNGMLDANIKSIVRDKSGKMWISTDRGISSIRTIDSDNGTSFSIRSFTPNEGLQTEYFNAHASGRDKDGRVYFGGNNGYTVIDTQNDVSDDEVSVPVFTEVCLGDSILPLPDRKEWGEASVKINHDDYQLKVSFFTGNLISANRVLYAYRLEGTNGKWTTTKDNSVTFFSLAPGKYTLEVKASGEDGEWGEVRQLTISVAPPFYLSWWMNIIYILITFAAIYFIIRYMHLRQQRRLEEQKVRIEQGQQVRLSEMKLRFFTNISHDLRTPLTLIISPLQSLMKEPLADDVRKRLSVINKNAQLLLNQVNMLLDFRRLDVGAENIKLQSIEIVHYVNDICLSFHVYAKERNISFNYTHSAENLFIDVDAEKLSKIMYNLLSNAFKFTPDGGTIDVKLTDQDKAVSLTVADSGPGIADVDKKQIFQRFYQIKNDDPKAGSGIGLHIVNEYVKMHNGTVQVTDNTPCGAVFTVTIPKKVMASVQQEPSESNPSERDMADGSQQAETQQGTSTQEEGNTPFSVLVVDDNNDLCTFVADSLRDTYTVHTAADGEEALQQLKANDINLVVSDIMMPKIDGLELCRRIKTDISTSHIPVILLTAKSADMSIIEGLQQGADDYITKPFNIEHLKLRIQKFIEWSKQRHQTFQQHIVVEPSEITITSLDEEFIKRAIATVEANLSDSDFSVDVLGRELGMSRTYLYKKISSITGKGPHDFIRTIRLKRAYRLLEKSQLQISEIAYQVGYSSPKRFSENFKAEYGMTPSDFLRSRKA